MSRLKTKSINLSELLSCFGIDPSPYLKVTERYPFRITSHYAGLIRKQGDPVWLQAIPSIYELTDEVQLPDPLDETRLSPVPGLIHRYPDRAVLLASNHCSVYCRFCMRKRQVGSGALPCDYEAAIDYIEATPTIRDLLVSGGDPLVIEIDRLHLLLSRLRKIKHLDIIRIGTRLPVVEPSLVTPDLCRMLASHHPLYLNTHFNHPVELTTESARACSLLADSGIQLGNQTVLLRGVNDNPEVLAELFTGLLKMRVRPYYLHQMDLVRGTAHFRTDLQEGMDLVQSLRGRISGMAIPHFCVDLPGGKGKVPLLLQSARKVEDGEWIIRTPDGEQVRYMDM